MTTRYVFYAFSALSRKLSIAMNTLMARCNLWAWGVGVGKDITVSGPINLSIHWTSTVFVGNQCRINSGFNVNPVGGHRKTGIYVGPGANLRIGNSVGISNTTIVCMNSIEIEDHAYIGGGCQIYDTDFHSLDHKLRGSKEDCPSNLPILLGENCFIGGHSIVLKGVSIGDGSVVGAGSVVTKSIPKNELWAGNPARFIRKLNPG